jgi:hypothetical protein
MFSTLRRLLSQQPFVPFTIWLADGRTFLVPHEDFIHVSVRGLQVVIYGRDGQVHHFNALVVVSVSYAEEKIGTSPS